MKCYDDSCDLSGSLTWFLLSRSQDTSICIPNFEPEKMSGPAVRVGAGWPRKMPCWHPRHRASWAREKNWSVFIGRLCWQGNVAGVCFFNFLFPLVHELRHDFWRCFFPSHEKFWPCFGDRNPLTGRVVSIRFYVKYTRFNIIIVFNQQCQNPLATAINIDCQTAFFLHPNIEFYQFSCRWYSQSIMWLTLCPSFHVSAVAALMPLLTPSVNLARISLQELFTGIDDDMNSTSGNLAGCRSGGKTRRF